MQIILLIVTISFIVFGLDVRNKNGMMAFVRPTYIRLMKLSALTLLVLYIHSIFGIGQSGWIEYLVLLCTTLGAVVVIAAKLGLGDSFTWTGHYLAGARLVTDGIYRYVRNPLYTGVFIFEAGATLNFAYNSVLKSEYPGLLIIVGGICLVYAISFNLVMAFKESQNLERLFGKDYLQYKHRTGKFLPKISLPGEVIKNAS